MRKIYILSITIFLSLIFLAPSVFAKGEQEVTLAPFSTLSLDGEEVTEEIFAPL